MYSVVYSNKAIFGREIWYIRSVSKRHDSEGLSYFDRKTTLATLGFRRQIKYLLLKAINDSK